MKFTQLRISNVKWRNILFVIGLVLVAFGLFYFYNYVNNNRKEGFDTDAATRAYNARKAIIDTETDEDVKLAVKIENDASKIIYNQLDIDTLKYFTTSLPTETLAVTALKNRNDSISDISNALAGFPILDTTDPNYSSISENTSKLTIAITMLTGGYDAGSNKIPSLKDVSGNDVSVIEPNSALWPYYKIGISVLSNLAEDLKGNPIKSPYLSPAGSGVLIDLKPAVDELNSRITGTPSTTPIPDVFKSMSLTDLKIKANFYKLDNPEFNLDNASPISETSGPSPNYIGSLFGPASSNTLSTDVGSPMGDTSVTGTVNTSMSGEVDMSLSNPVPLDSPFIISTDNGYDLSPPNPAILSLPKQISTKKSNPAHPKQAQSNYKTSMTPHVKNLDDKSSQQISEILKIANENKKHFNKFISNITKKCEYYPHACADILPKSSLQKLSDNTDKLKKIDIPKVASALKQNAK
jgi:hypothetical protein